MDTKTPLPGLINNILSASEGGELNISPPLPAPIIEHYTPPPATIDFHTMHQGRATNTLAKIRTRIGSPAQLNLYGDGVIEEKDFKLFIEKYKDLAHGVKPTAKMLLDALAITATETNQRDTLVRLPLGQYMAWRGLQDVKEARKQVKDDIAALDKLRIEYRERRKGKQGDFLNISLSGGTNGIVNSIILFRFNPDFFNILMSYPIMLYPKEALAINPKHNPHSYYFLRRISEHKNMNYQKQNEDIISVKTLIEASPELPKYDELGEAGQVHKRIIDPFERDMDAIHCLKWNYCGKNETPIEPPATYAEFERANVKITWINYPIRVRRKIPGKKPKKQDLEGGGQQTPPEVNWGGNR